jgi:hypothetical protein
VTELFAFERQTNVVRFDVLTVVLLNIHVFSDVKLC